MARNFFVFRGSRQKLLAGALVKSDGMQLVWVTPHQRGKMALLTRPGTNSCQIRA